MAYLISRHMVSLQQDSMDTPEPTSSNSNRTDADDRDRDNQSTTKGQAGSQGWRVELKSVKPGAPYTTTSAKKFCILIHPKSVQRNQTAGLTG